MAVYVGSARIDENGKAYGGKAGDQTGKEVSKQKFYVHSKGWRVFRAKDRNAALKIAEAMEAACVNKYIGYDQWQRNTLYTQAEKYGFNIGKVKTDCETDCSALVRVCCAWAGIMGLPAEFRTGNMPQYLLGTGDFIELKGSKYTGQSTYLGKGDILVTKTSGHTVVVLDDGPKYEEVKEEKPVQLGDRILKNGSEGEDVKVLQEYLITLGYDLGKWGADGDYGDATELAVMRFQRDNGLDDDGDYGPKTHAKLMEVIDREEDKAENAAKRVVRIVGGNCWARTAPNTDGEKLGVAKNGWTYDYQGQTSENDWHLIEYDGQNGWVSGKYGKVE